MYCFLFFVLLMGVDGQNNTITTKGLSETTVIGGQGTQSETSLSHSRSEEATPANLPKINSSGREPGNESQLPGLTANPTPCPKNSLCVNDILQPLPLIVIGALAITCFTLLVITLVLAFNTCCLKRKISSSYQVCSDTAQSTKRRVSVNCEQSETHLMMNEINGKPEGEEIQAEPKEPEKPEEVAKEVQDAKVPNQASTEGFTQNEMPTTESPPNQDFPAPIEDTEIPE